MKTKEQLQAKIQECEAALIQANIELNEFMTLPENNTFPSLETASCELYTRLLDEATEACEGSYNCGKDTYTQEFTVNGERYLATLEVEYNRYNKQYYYIDSNKFTTKRL